MKRPTVRIRLWFALVLLLALACGGGPSSSAENIGESSRPLCTSATFSLTPVVPGTDQQLGKAFTITSNAGGCVTGTPEYRFDHKRPDSPWQVERDWSSSNTWLWDTATANNGALEPGGIHLFQVLVREAGGAFEAYTHGAYYLPPFPCSGGGSVTASPPSASGHVGSAIVFANFAPGCTSPEFRIDHLRPGASTWQTESAYSTGNSTWQWNTQVSNLGDPEPAGFHYFQIFIRAKESGAIFESYFDVEYYLSREICDQITSTPTLEWAPVGSKVTINSSASDCSSARFRIDHLRPGASNWQTDSDYSAANASYDWFTGIANSGTPEVPGVHYFQILARAGDSNDAYESYADVTIQLASQEYPELVTATAPASPQPTGRLVTFSSSSNRYPDPEYQIWHIRPNGSVLTSGFSRDNSSWQWDTSNEAAGMHRFYVVARESGTSAPSSSLTIYYTLSPNNYACEGDGTNPRCAHWVSARGPTGVDPFDRTTWVFGDKGYVLSVYPQTALIQVPGLSDVRSVTSGYANFCALASANVYCWGYNWNGQVGDGTTTERTAPVLVLPSAAKLSTGLGHSCAISDGAAYCWGGNFYGAIGDGGTEDRLSPTAVASLPAEVTAVSTGEYHSCAISGGAVYCWGLNNSGQLGLGDANGSRTPAQVHSLAPRATAIAAGTRSSCAIVDGEVWCWGSNANGALGDGTTSDSSLPVRVGGNQIRQASTVAVGLRHACASTPDGIYCWGSNASYELGDGTNIDKLAPVRVLGMNRPADSLSAGYANSCVTISGLAYCWGSNVWHESSPSSTQYFQVATAIESPTLARLERARATLAARRSVPGKAEA
ncbi:MAG: hypothetical protein QM756_43880 [Polyangiaceae bacterium]